MSSTIDEFLEPWHGPDADDLLLHSQTQRADRVLTDNTKSLVKLNCGMRLTFPQVPGCATC